MLRCSFSFFNMISCNVTLKGEPQRFDLEADRVEAELDTLVLDNYKIFVDNLTCSVQLKNEV